jgi:hypothetical protein
MKKAFIIIFCFLLLGPLPCCRKKSKSDKQFEKTTKARIAQDAARAQIEHHAIRARMAMPL